MICPACGARNGASSAWCTQCFAPLGASSPPPVELATRPPAGATVPPSAQHRDVRQVGDQVEWRCARCGGWTALARADCATCGAARAGFGEGAGPRQRRLPTGTAVLLSVVVPGAAHVVAGRVGSGIARAVLALGWLAVALTTWGDGAGPSPVALTFLAGALAVWTGTLVDSARLDRPGAREVLRSRILLVLVAAVTLLGVVAVLLDVLG